MGTPGAEIRQPPGRVRIGLARRVLDQFEKREPLADPSRGIEPLDAPGDGAGDDRRRQRAGGRQQRLAVLVGLADDPRTAVGRPVKQHLLELRLQNRALFLYDENFLQAAGEALSTFGVQRPRHAHLVGAETDGGGQRVVDAEIVERLQNVQEGLAGGDDADPPARPVHDHPVQRVGPREGARRRQLMIMEARVLDRRRPVVEADVEAAGRRREPFGKDDARRVGRDLDGRGGVDVVALGLHADPASGKPRQRPAVQAEIEKIADVGRYQHRHSGVDHRVFALARRRRRLGGGIVAGDRQDTAERRRAGEIGMAQCVAGAVDAGALAVPQSEHAVVPGARKQPRLLRTPQRGGRQVLVDAGLEVDLVLRQQAADAP